MGEEIVTVPVKDIDGNVIGMAKVKVEITIGSIKTLQELEDDPEPPQVKYSETVRKYFEDKKGN